MNRPDPSSPNSAVGRVRVASDTAQLQSVKGTEPRSGMPYSKSATTGWDDSAKAATTLGVCCVAGIAATRVPEPTADSTYPSASSCS
ncbi:hypothetical protein LWC34_06220 [Kibdelosporangium philippinense]|uniref:Uncharacterized protein n=1 Tax=Kibdelosporangium philippinense TaxID=211113 RepID=A0ABS8Z3C7_9PSEU|nr:hypothetical protein [Kibdelosporangium philippinense]MCE7002429.1 hypothetical protein [Kibdelosporangium philippinense]